MTKKECNDRYNKTKNGVVSAIYGSQRSNSKRRGHNPPTYSNTELREWIYSQPLFHVLYDNWKRLDFQSMYKPSVDRTDSKLGYTMANIQLMTWQENNDKGRYEHLSGSDNKNSGSKHGMSKKKEHYSISATKKADFKRTCGNQGWNFQDFVEIDSGEKYGTNKKFYYTLKEMV